MFAYTYALLCTIIVLLHMYLYIYIFVLYYRRKSLFSTVINNACNNSRLWCKPAVFFRRIYYNNVLHFVRIYYYTVHIINAIGLGLSGDRGGMVYDWRGVISGRADRRRTRKNRIIIIIIYTTTAADEPATIMIYVCTSCGHHAVSFVCIIICAYIIFADNNITSVIYLAYYYIIIQPSALYTITGSVTCFSVRVPIPGMFSGNVGLYSNRGV